MSNNGKPIRTAYIGQPSYGSVVPESATAYWLASIRDPQIGGVAYELRIDRNGPRGSLLAQGHNAIWCWALNAEKDGQQVDYVGMLHSDVCPQPGWLDVLIEELESHDLDIIGAAIPLKDQHGLTTLALEREDGDTWSPLCRLTLEEVFRLPPTFTADDIGHPLLLNTGCWICRFDPSWARQVYFTINDRIVFDRSLDRYVAQVEPEDWFFSRLLNEIGLRVGATRKVKLIHEGPYAFSNVQPWGDQRYDEAFIDASVIPEPDGWIFPHDVDGWLLPEEGEALAEYCRGKRVLEIGSYLGRSTICIAQAADYVMSIDPHDGRGTPIPRETMEGFTRNLERYGVLEKVNALKTHPSEYDGLFDVAFIDGAHDYESVKEDIEICLANLKADGLLLFHDYRTDSGECDGRWDPGVTQAVNEYISSGATLVARHSTVAVVKPPALVLET